MDQQPKRRMDMGPRRPMDGMGSVRRPAAPTQPVAVSQPQPAVVPIAPPVPAQRPTPKPAKPVKAPVPAPKPMAAAVASPATAPKVKPAKQNRRWLRAVLQGVAWLLVILAVAAVLVELYVRYYQ